VRPLPSEPLSPRSILVVRLSALGDVLQVLPALDALAQRFPAAKIDVVTETLSSSLLERHPALRRVIEFPRARARAAWKDRTQRSQTWQLLARFVRQLREHEYDLLLDWQSNLRSAVIRMLARAHRVIGIHPSDGGELPGWWPGYRPAVAACSTHKVHRVERALHVVRALGWEGQTPAGQLGNFDTVHLEGDHGPNQPVLLHPFVSAFGRFKEWPSSRWEKLAHSLARRGLPVLISGAPGDQHKIAQIVQNCGYAAAPAPCTSSLAELTKLIDRCRAVVAADTGVVHLAAIRKVPTVGLYGPKDPTVNGPWGENCRVIRGEIPCSPCTLRNCEHSFCMQSITPESVENALLDLLSTTTRAR